MRTFTALCVFSVAWLLGVDHCQGQNCRNGQCYQWSGGQRWYSVQGGKSVSWKQGDGEYLAKHSTIQKTLGLINADRARHGRAPLTLDEGMCVTAQNHSEYMSRLGYNRHSSGPYSECVFAGPRDSTSACNGFFRSSAHHAILLSGSRCGIGVSDRGRTKAWVIQVR